MMNGVKKILFLFLLSLGFAGFAQTNYFVSATTGSDSNDGSTWQKAFKTMDKAISMGQSTAGTYNLYFAQGTYSGAQHILGAGVQMNLYGGFPVPGATTIPTNICNPSTAAYPTDFSGSGNQTIFRLQGNGGGVSLNNFTITNIIGNNADGAFVTVDTDSSNKNVVLKNMHIKKYGTGIGGFIYVYRSTNVGITIDHSAFENGSFNAAAEGGAIVSVANLSSSYSKNVDVVVTNSTFNSNRLTGTSASAGTALFSMQMDYPTDQGQSSLSIDQSKFCDNRGSTASGQSAPVFVTNNVKTVSVTNSRFLNNIGGEAGVAQLRNISKLTSANNLYQGNTTTSYGAVTISGNFPDATADAEISTFTNDKFYSNKSTDITYGYGSALMVSSNKRVNVADSDFNGNTAATHGGAIYINSANTQTITNTKFCNNTANGDGGAINMTGGGTLNISANTVFTGNKANGSTMDGGAIWTNGTANISDAQFYTNTSGGDGGVIWFEGNRQATVARTVFNGNTANEGGAVYKTGDNLLSVSNSYFINNTSNATAAANGGGAVYVEGSNYTSNTNYYSGNKATSQGGAVFFVGNQTVRSSNDVFTFNAAGAGGGGLKIYGTGSPNVYIDGTNFTSNSANAGGGLGTDFNGNGTVNIINTTFSKNTASNRGGAIEVRNGLAGDGPEIDLIDNSKFYGNTVGSPPSATNTTRTERSEIFLGDGISYFAKVGSITNSAMQFVPNTTNYPTGGYTLGAGNSQQTTAIADPAAYTLPATIPCSTVTAAVCTPVLAAILPMAVITATDTDETALNSVTTCAGSTATVNFSSASGTPAITFSYVVQKVTTATGAVISTSAVQTVSVNSNTAVATVTTEAIQSGVTYNYIMQSVTDAAGQTTNYGSCQTNMATIVAKDCACYNPANTTGTPVLPTNHGITALGRAGASQDNWPMVRTGAWTVLEAKTKGFVVTRMTTAQIGAIASPQEGMMTYDTDVKCLKLYDGTKWSCFTTPSCP